MRLIDADVLKLELRRYQIESLIEHSEEKNVFDVINEQPTAYDREKVMAELEEEKRKVFIDGKEMYQENYFIDIDRAIGMVKRGGAE
jgi:hypothetical protein